MEKRSYKAMLKYLPGIAAVVALDQWFKSWIVGHIPLNSGTLPLLPGVVHLSHIHNSGAAFSMLEGSRVFFLLLLALFAVLVGRAIRSRFLETEFDCWVAALAVGGALGNGIDRFRMGYVVDMFELEFMRFAVFNIADIVLCVCAGLYVLRVLTSKEKTEAK